MDKLPQQITAQWLNEADPAGDDLITGPTSYVRTLPTLHYLNDILLDVSAECSSNFEKRWGTVSHCTLFTFTRICNAVWHI